MTTAGIGIITSQPRSGVINDIGDMFDKHSAYIANIADRIESALNRIAGEMPTPLMANGANSAAGSSNAISRLRTIHDAVHTTADRLSNLAERLETLG